MFYPGHAEVYLKVKYLMMIIDEFVSCSNHYIPDAAPPPAWRRGRCARPPPPSWRAPGCAPRTALCPPCHLELVILNVCYYSETRFGLLEKLPFRLVAGKWLKMAQPPSSECWGNPSEAYVQQGILQADGDNSHSDWKYQRSKKLQPTYWLINWYRYLEDFKNTYSSLF